MVFAHLNTTPDTESPTGSPIPVSPDSAGHLVLRPLAAMTSDLHDSIYGEAAANRHFAGVIGAGDAFQMRGRRRRGQDRRLLRCQRRVHPEHRGDVMNLWWDDYLHASKYGSYLDALVQFGTITGLDPRLLGGGEIAARDLGISTANALTLQTVAARQLGFAVPEPGTMATMLLGVALIGAMRRRAG